MPPRSRTFLRLTRALLACLVVFLAFEPLVPRIELAPPVAAAVASPARAPIARRVEAPRIAPARSIATVDEPLATRSNSQPREPLLRVRRLYVELCSLLR